MRAGWAEVFVFERDFLRLSAYLDAEGDAEGSVRGVWKRCDGDFDFSRADELRERRFRLWTSCGATTGASQTASSPRPGGCCRDAFVET